MRPRHILYFFLFLFPLQLSGREAQDYFDSSEIRKIELDDEKLQSYKDDTDFIYYYENPKPGLIQQFLNWLFKKIASVFKVPEGNLVGKIFLALVVVSIAIVLILLILKIDSGKKLIPLDLPLHTALQFEGTDEELGRKISELIAEKNYNEAVRYSLIHVLRVLRNKEFILWKSNKTNRDYLHELSNKGFSDSYRQLSYYFDYSHYGHFHLDEREFETANRAYTEILKQTGGAD